MTLVTNAEKKADKTRELPGFKEFSLPGMRDQVAELLNQIGRVHGVFTTYTKHDISHIDAMLKMLDWLEPALTNEKMTPADWLLATLAIYLHDLGMVVTSDEFEKRHDNPVFRRWFDTLGKTNEGRDYVARTHRMTPDEKERFFFQEYVRMGHASRIREWITGHHTRTWGPEVKSFAAEVHKLLLPLPVRFREYLGVVCESHHADDLSKREILPLYAPCGTEVEEAVNVQYAAILLRTADLLHVTKDRTPSIMFQTVKLSDPKGVDEWDKQLGTFAVLPKKREFDPGDPDAVIIQVSANFRVERPLFALQEYITYANGQVFQSHRWAEKSREDADAKNYLFPWRQVKGDVRLEGVPPHPLKFELDRWLLLDLLVGHTIYNDPTVAVRELLQNGIDAVRFEHHLKSREARAARTKPNEIGKVCVRWNANDRHLVVEDNGTGMDQDTIENHLMRVGISFYNTPQFETDHRDFSPISRFGIGVLTCFMVSDDIEIVTCRDGRGWRIRMTSVHADYLLTELAANHGLLAGIEPHGTRVTLRLRDTIDTGKNSIADIVKYWVILPPCPVEYHEPGKEPERIGFDSVAEALSFLCGQTLAKDKDSSRDDSPFAKSEIEYEVKTAAGSTGAEASPGKYELAIALQGTRRMERQFAALLNEDAPAVCIEGIRVSASLPWFNAKFQENRRGSKSLSCLLAVSGDRRFRTTVSRSELEEDEEYHRVGGICADLLFQHVREEVELVSRKQGKPLSQASTCSTWLYEALKQSANTSRALKRIESLRVKLPCIVTERLISPDEGILKTERTLLTPEQLTKEPSFWTIESRLVDSLGTISRDLGRELSLNEFLVALAPDFRSLQYSPLLPDAPQFRDVILESHTPQTAQFSLEHQQSAIKWERLDNVPATNLWDANVPDYRMPEPGKVMQMRERVSDSWTRQMQRTFGLSRSSRYLPAIVVAPIEGDDPDVQAIVSRMGVILTPNSALETMWKALQAVMTLLDGSSFPDEIQEQAALGIITFITRLSGKHHFEESNWRKVANTLRNLISETDVDFEVPEELNKFIRRGWLFDASKYWINWYSDDF